MSKQKKPSPKIQAKGPLARKVLSKYRGLMREKVADLGAWREGRRLADEVKATLAAKGGQEDLDPLHGLFVFAQHHLSVMVEMLAMLPELRKLTDALAAAEEEYLPSGPPMSPLTHSYFLCWSTLDLTAGPKQESFATVALDLYRQFGMEPEFLQLISAVEGTRMGLYVHEGSRGERIQLRELVTGLRHEVICPAGYTGHKDEVWLVRLLHWPFASPGPGYSVVLNTPYVIVPIGTKDPAAPKLGAAADWMGYFSRTLPRGSREEQEAAYVNLMKYGPSKNYWNEYIFLAYVNYQQDMVLLSGIPDRRESLPVGDLARN